LGKGSILAEAVQKIGASLIAAVLLLLFAADPIACSDGCTNDPPSQSKPAVCCILCQRGIAVGGAALTVAPAITVQPAPSLQLTALLPALGDSIDHPPRLT